MFLLQRLFITWAGLMVLASSVTAIAYIIFLIGRLFYDLIRFQQVKKLLKAVFEEREKDIYYWVEKLHAQNFVFARGENILYYAIKNHRKRAVQCLLSAHVPIEYEVNHQFRISVLSMAIVEKEPLEYIQLLVLAGADILYRDSYDKTPLQYAKECERSDQGVIMTILMEAMQKKTQDSNNSGIHKNDE